MYSVTRSKKRFAACGREPGFVLIRESDTAAEGV